MTTIELNIKQKPISCSIIIEENLFSHPERWLSDEDQKKQMVIITDDHVNALYGEKLFSKLNNPDVLLLSFPAGESSKNQKIKQDLEEKMLEHRCGRETIVLALGGGVVGDVAGFAASTYLRGVSCIQLPTTLLAMVDSSIGGKTAINTPFGKNLIGAFHQPKKVVMDMNCLHSLPLNQLLCGVVEAVKMFLTHDAEQFYFTDEHLDHIIQKDNAILKHMIEHAMKIKMGIVERDEKESGERMTCNFGHTIGHAIERVMDYSILHGYAVAHGILVESKLSQLLGLLSLSDYKCIQKVFLRLGFSGQFLKKFDPEKLIRATETDKKVREKQVHYVLLNRIGKVHQVDHAYAHPVSNDLVKQALHEVSEGKL